MQSSIKVCSFSSEVCKVERDNSDQTLHRDDSGWISIHLFTGILKISPANQQLFKDNQVMEDEKALQDYGLTSNSAKAQCPGSVGLALR
jgi:hypothetical protein